MSEKNMVETSLNPELSEGVQARLEEFKDLANSLEDQVNSAEDEEEIGILLTTIQTYIHTLDSWYNINIADKSTLSDREKDLIWTRLMIDNNSPNKIYKKHLKILQPKLDAIYS